MIKERLIRQKIVGISFLAGFLLIAGGFLWSFLSLRGLAEPFIIHWNAARGINQIGGLMDLIIMGAFGELVIIANFFIALELDVRDRFLGKLVAAATLFFAFLLFLTFRAIIAVN